MKKIKCGVIGVGYLGRFHAQKYKLLDNVELIGVCDIEQNNANSVAHELQVTPYYDYRDLLSSVDAVSIAATTKAHYKIAHDFLSHGVHVLLEKPMTETLEQAQTLINLAKSNNIKLQIGHLERFNSARVALEPHLDKPLFIESNRLAPFNPRGTDVNVVLDLMIHDIDLIHAIVNSPIKSIDAHGAPVLTKSPDIANARIVFDNHCVANVTASRISFKSERKMRIFQKNTYISIDYQDKKFAIFERGKHEMFPGIPEIIRYQSAFEKGDALLEQIKSFIKCIVADEEPIVGGEQGFEALDTADKITNLIKQNLNNHNESV